MKYILYAGRFILDKMESKFQADPERLQAIDSAVDKIDRRSFGKIAAGHGDLTHFELRPGNPRQDLGIKHKIIRILLEWNTFQHFPGERPKAGMIF